MTPLSKGFYLYMATDAQDAHIMKAHLRKLKVFHGISKRRSKEHYQAVGERGSPFATSSGKTQFGDLPPFETSGKP